MNSWVTWGWGGLFFSWRKMATRGCRKIWFLNQIITTPYCRRWHTKPIVWTEEFVLDEYGAVKNNYKSTFDFPPFTSPWNNTVLNIQGEAKIYIDGKFRYEYWPYITLLKKIDIFNKRGNTPDSHPSEWFNLFVPQIKRRQDITEMALII